jgi:hypothetical protein
LAMASLIREHKIARRGSQKILKIFNITLWLWK